MKGIVTLGVVAVVAFALSGALSLYLFSVSKPEADHAKTKGDEKKHESGKKRDEKEHDEKEHDEKDGHPRPSEKTDPHHSPRKGEEVADLGKRLEKQLKDLERREDAVRQHEDRVRLVIDDIHAERAVMSDFRSRIADETRKLDAKREKASRSESDADERKAEVRKLLDEYEKAKLKFGPEETKNLERMAGFVESMPPESAAKLMEQLANTGQMETAVKLLGQMKERRGAAVLAAFTDTALVAQMVGKLRDLKRAPVLPPLDK